MAEQLSQLLKRLEAVTVRLEEAASKQKSDQNGSAVADASKSSAGDSPSIAAFEELVSGPLVTYFSLSKTIGGLVEEQSKLFNDAINAQRQLLIAASKHKKPADAKGLQDMLKPLSDLMQKVVEIREKNRPSPLFNHLSVVSEGVPALGWVAVEPKPAPYVGDMKDAAQFYVNRILKDYKEKEKTHVDWATAFSTFLTDLQAFVKKFHTTGLVWNANGQAASPAPISVTVTPPAAPAVNTSTKPPMAALFGELNKGGEITSGLKKVEKSQMTHKNPELRASGIVRVSESASPSVVNSTTSLNAAKKPAKFALEGHKWCIENQEGNQGIVVDNTELKQVVYIYNCTNSVIQIKGKVNAVVVDGCKKTSVVLDSVVSSLELVNCKSIQAQIIGTSPTAAISKTDGVNLFLSNKCLGIEIFTSKSSEINVTIPGKTEQDDPVEKPVPEQFKTVVRNGALFTEIVEHKG